MYLTTTINLVKLNKFIEFYTDESLVLKFNFEIKYQS